MTRKEKIRECIYMWKHMLSEGYEFHEYIETVLTDIEKELDKEEEDNGKI